jgi:hypothetical protein
MAMGEASSVIKCSYDLTIGIKKNCSIILNYSHGILILVWNLGV